MVVYACPKHGVSITPGNLSSRILFLLHPLFFTPFLVLKGRIFAGINLSLNSVSIFTLYNIVP